MVHIYLYDKLELKGLNDRMVLNYLADNLELTVVYQSEQFEFNCKIILFCLDPQTSLVLN